MKVPELTLPPLLARVNARLPMAPPSWVFVALLNQLLKRGVVPADMSLLAGRRFEIDVTDAGVRLLFSADRDRFIRDAGRG